MIFADAHCHLGSRRFDENREEVVSRMLESSVEKAILICCSEHDRIDGIKLRDSHPGFKLACSVHPQALEGDDSPERLVSLKKAVIESHADMIGETGLDYHSHPHTKEAQMRFFEAQLEMAAELGLPVNIHSRKASLDTLTTLRKYPVKGIMHSFSGSLEMAQLYVKLGYFIAFGASVLFPNSRKPAHVIAGLPIDKILVETDAPYQSPIEGHTHEPADAVSIYRKIAEIKSVSLEVLTAQLEENFDSVFSER